MQVIPKSDKDNTSSKLGVKGSKTADAIRFAELHRLRKQLDALPVPIRESARQSYLADQDLKQRDLQDFQCVMVAKFEKMIRKQLDEQHLDFRKFKIGGHERGTYERFFRVEPSRFMSLPQFVTAIRRVFGDTLLTSEKQINKLYYSFDLRRQDEMDWRSFLFLITLVMQPDLPVEEHLRYSYAIYSSSGSLDLDCRDPLPLSVIKDMMVAPVLLSMRSDLKTLLDNSWTELTLEEIDAAESAKRAYLKPEEALLSFSLFQKLLHNTSFAPLLQVARVFGKRDPRPWTFVLEEEFFHPLFLDSMLKLRRIARNEDECRKFQVLRISRAKQMAMDEWKDLVRKRQKVRKMIIMVSIRWRNDRTGRGIDRWRAWVIQTSCANLIQRYIRGFLARRRRDFIKRMQTRASLVQSGTRQMQSRIVYQRIQRRRNWAATSIQRIIRGFSARKRVQTILEAYVDTQRRLLARDRDRWMRDRFRKASICIQMVVRRFLRVRRSYRRYKLQEKVEEMQEAMDRAQEQRRVEKEVYRQELEQWFVTRKEEYDKTRVLEEHTAEQRAKIVSYRNRKDEFVRLKMLQDRETRIAKLEENRIEAFLRMWDNRKIERAAEAAKKCRRALHNPENVEEIALRKDLQKRIKKHLKTVLRRADKQKIPMEIPEATDLATREIIEMEVEAEKKRVDEERFAEATRLQAIEDEKAENTRKQEEEARYRKRGWAAQTLQGHYRCFQARKLLRSLAYKRYQKHFDPGSLNYYYEDNRTHKTFWTKPKSLGSYDIDCEEGWMILRDRDSDAYFYNPQTWKMQWGQPQGTVLCGSCGNDFAMYRLSLDTKFYCVPCFNSKCQSLTETMNPVSILFKEFNGGKEKASATKFTFVPETNWYAHIVKADPTLRESMEHFLKEEEEERRRKALLCSRCQEVMGDMKCDMCQVIFCVKCFEFKHSKPPWNAHSFSPVPKLEEKKIADKSQDDGKKKKKKKKKKKAADGSSNGGDRAKSPSKRSDSPSKERSQSANGEGKQRGKSPDKGGSRPASSNKKERSGSPSKKKKDDTFVAPDGSRVDPNRVIAPPPTKKKKKSDEQVEGAA